MRIIIDQNNICDIYKARYYIKLVGLRRLQSGPDKLTQSLIRHHFATRSP